MSEYRILEYRRSRGVRTLNPLDEYVTPGCRVCSWSPKHRVLKDDRHSLSLGFVECKDENLSVFDFTGDPPDTTRRTKFQCDIYIVMFIN